ncbi:uncharacterized protein [Prorops nasuta]|uniref:uncharacterized protein n=1 Tax=Prorops nasuta TaxID=863751 RepID=UPI0034CE4427
MIDILDIQESPVLDNRITKIEIHGYNPYANTNLRNNDEIRIPIQHQDLYILPSQCFLYIEGKVTRTDEGKDEVFLDNNCMAFLFDEIRYELDGVEIDQCRNVGITTSIKNYLSVGSINKNYIENAGWCHEALKYTTSDKKLFFNFCVPLRMLLGFCEDYNHIVINARHELILIRSRNDLNSLFSGYDKPKVNASIELTKIQWKIPHITLEEMNKLAILRFVENGNVVTMNYRTWDLYEYPLLQSSTKHTWAVKVSTQLEKPRFKILALQTNRKDQISNQSHIFDHCNISNVRLYLNSESYPYDNLNIDFDKNNFSLLYLMYSKFKSFYYGLQKDNLLTLNKFKNIAPLIVIDCSRQVESIKNGTVDIRIDFECKKDIPLNTSAYCLILHYRIVEYSPLTNIVRKIT